MEETEREESTGHDTDDFVEPQAGIKSSNKAQANGIVVRILSASDMGKILPLCKVLERRVFPKHESLAERLDKEIKRRNVLIVYAMSDGSQTQLAGYTLVSWQAPRRGTLEKVCVSQAYRRQGIGKALCETSIAALRSRGVSEVYLHVDPAREAAIALYTSLGFNQHGAMITSYYCEGRDAIRMVKCIEEA